MLFFLFHMLTLILIYVGSRLILVRILELSEMKFFGILVSYLLFLKLVHLPFLIPTAFTITIFAVPLLLFAIYNLLEDNRISAYIFILLAAIILPALTMWFGNLICIIPNNSYVPKQRTIHKCSSRHLYNWSDQYCSYYLFNGQKSYNMLKEYLIQ